ncbi:Phosphoribosylformimino-5-aminoimidazole carboxamide ribotide isomerase [Lentinula edodes]|uniref:Phosphoribosylformimino-5-aminoimidazole carboxamide ribotide isomerase n=1 Tax=Lentinula edodes TaxID=5353 RepID=A0A1Q3EDR8_LENED|nr:Phosphoribosylformimino-5-aminoimidazole carboxamide ribotide isomerase [Lentinula edodes]
MTERRSVFRPCIDLHGGQVKQIVGGTLSDTNPNDLKTNFVSHHLPSLHVFTKTISLRVGMSSNWVPETMKQLRRLWQRGQEVFKSVEGSLTRTLRSGSRQERVIVTSYLFPESKFSLAKLEAISTTVGKDRLVVDVSCRRKGEKWFVAMNKWQDLTEMEVCQESLDLLSNYCSEFLVHAADVEGLCQGIDEVLVTREWCRIPVTYAGGAKDVSDLDLVDRLSLGRVDLTYGRYISRDTRANGS